LTELESPPNYTFSGRQAKNPYVVQDSYEFDDRERFEPAFEAVLAGHILRNPQTHALHVFFTKAGIVYFPRLETESNLRVIDFIRPVVQVASGEVWVGPTRGFDLTTRIRLTAIVVRGVSVPAGWKESSSGAISTPHGHLALVKGRRFA
jgi:hypothetical protein